MNRVVTLIKDDAPLDMVDIITQETPLIHCIVHGEYLLCKLLLEGGADVNKCAVVNLDSDNIWSGELRSPISVAVSGGHEFITALLIQHGLI
jgi:hypothetical protein